MGLYQNTILEKYKKTYHEEIAKAYREFSAYFLNKNIQENIKQSKEEQFQEGFLHNLFVKVLGYTLNPNPNYNLITEKKNETDAKKADGAILVNGEVIGIIELKDTKTINLKQVETQAFGYKNNHRKAIYVITSNFEKLRFYINNAVDFIEFNLFNLDLEDFSTLWLSLAYPNVVKGLPIHIKNESVSSEDQITKQLYKEYSEFKRFLFNDLVKLNPQYNKLVLFKKSQKLLDRFLFIFFAEDSLLLPPNSIAEIIKQWEQLKELDAYTPLYNRIKKYFGYMNTGHKGKKHDIFAYNGGLFQPDEILDNVKIGDEVLHDYLLKISSYNFASEVDVNILGHIFENSLTEIEEISKAIENNEDTTAISKRKKDGIFYTPKYITTYIVENTLGKLCIDKKNELDINEEDFFTDKRRQKATSKKLLDKLETYRKWLKGLTICDPACGSGAFLNAALDFLISEHKLIDEMTAKIHKSTLVFADIENAILENNLYGVDINEESVEIAKLSLWLRTAKPNRKLNSLSNNIKCGNSLISDPKVAGDKAFDWEKEFPHVFTKGGFDVVIGNPPYVLCQPSNTPHLLLEAYKKFKVASYKIDLYHLFFEKGISILNNCGLLGFITPNTYLTNIYSEKLRFFILTNTDIYNLTQNASNVFIDAGVDVCTIFLQKPVKTKSTIDIYNLDSSGMIFHKNKLNKQNWIDNLNYAFNIYKEFKIKNHKILPLGNIASVTFGLQTKDKKTYVKSEQETEEWEACYTGKDISRYHLKNPTLFFLNNPEIVKAGGSWNMDIHHSKKIVVRQVGAPEPVIAYDNLQHATLNTMYSIVVNDSSFIDKYILACINSNLIKHWWLSKYFDNKDLFPKIKGKQLKSIPIKEISIEAQQPFIEKANMMLNLNEELQTVRQRFTRRLIDNMEGIKINRKLDTFDQLEFRDFLKELTKQKIKLSLTDQDEWEEYFTVTKNKCNQLFEQIAKTDKEIDQMVYELYELTDEEIAIVEENS